MAKILHSALPLASLLLAACGGAGGGGSGAAIPLMGGAVQSTALSLASASATPAVSTLAGALLGADGTGGMASFNNPGNVVSDGTNLYVADSGNNTIRQVVIATGATTTLAGTAGMQGNADGTGAAATFAYPTGITTDNTNLYVADRNNGKIRQIVIATGVVTTLAGSYNCNWWDAASFCYPSGITTDGTNLYVSDTNNHSIRKIVIATAVVTTFATGIYYPQGITTDGTNLYVAQPYNRRILQIAISSGVVTTLAGGNYGATDGAGTAATFYSPYGITTDGTNLYVADSNNNKIRKIVIATGVVSSFTGIANTQMASGAADGAGSSATFNSPQGITSSGGNLYVADSGNNTIRQIAIATQEVSTLAGAAPGADGTGAAARFNYPGHTTTDGTNLYVADSSDYTIRKIVIATGAVTTLAGKSGEWGFVDGTGADARFGYPVDITTDGTNLYVTDTDNYTIRKIVIATGAVTSLAGSGNSGNRDGTGAQALFQSPVDITTDGTNLYVTDDSNNNIRKIVIATRVVTTLAGSVNSRGSADGTGTAALFSNPSGITTDGTNLYVADSNNNKIRKIVIATGVVTSFTGVADTQMGSAAVDGAAVDATFSYPQGITTDGTNLYVADSNNNKIRKIVIATGEVSSVTGAANAYVSAGRTDGAAVDASFDYPYGITTDGTSLYVSDDNNSTIRKIQ
jgi:sugar lactone lactonase YvrE